MLLKWWRKSFNLDLFIWYSQHHNIWQDSSTRRSCNKCGNPLRKITWPSNKLCSLHPLRSSASGMKKSHTHWFLCFHFILLLYFSLPWWLRFLSARSVCPNTNKFEMGEHQQFVDPIAKTKLKNRFYKPLKPRCC